MHPVDWAAGLLIRVSRRRLGIFPDGWGDRDRLSLFSRLPTVSDAPEPVSIEWDGANFESDLQRRSGRFRSPIAELLPPSIADVPVEMISPARPSGVCVLMPSWNDHGFAQRRKLGRLLALRGIGAVVFDVPLYGSRRTTDGPDQAIRTVADFAQMGFGAVAEGRALIAALAAASPAGISGYSMGGNLAAIISASLPFPVATAALAASHSPGPVYLDGILRKGIVWRALGGNDPQGQLRSVLGSATTLTYPPLPHHRQAVIVAATRDGFVPASATRDLADHWPGSELRWVKAGHATLLWRHRMKLADAIVESFDRLKTSADPIT